MLPQPGLTLALGLLLFSPLMTAAEPATLATLQARWLEGETQSVALPFDASAVAATFTLRNDGPQALRIAGIESGCVCGKPDSPDALPILPGTERPIPLSFPLGGSHGAVRRVTAIWLAGADGQRVRCVLTIDASVPAAWTAEPGVLRWTRGDTEPKRTRISLHPDWTWTLDEVLLPAGLQGALHRDEDGAHWLTVTPPGTGARLVDSVRIQTSASDPRFAQLLIPLFIP